MKITKAQLKQIIREELGKLNTPEKLEENYLPPELQAVVDAIEAAKASGASVSDIQNLVSAPPETIEAPDLNAPPDPTAGAQHFHGSRRKRRGLGGSGRLPMGISEE